MNIRAAARSFLRRAVILDERISASLTLASSLKPSPLHQCIRWVVILGAHLGDGILWLAIGLVAYVLSGPQGRGEVLFIVVVLLLAGSLISVIKLLVHRQRPTSTSNKSVLYLNYDKYSFPSGHACRVLCLVVLLGSLHPAWAALLWGLACWVALCRVMIGVHHVSDVLVGALIGYGTGLLAWQLSPLFLPR